MKKLALFNLVSLTVLLGCLAGTALAGFSGSDVFLPMVGRQAGIFPSNWFTTVWIYNPGTEAATARIYLLERGTANPSPPWVDVPVAPGDTEKIENVVESLFHAQVFGALRVTCDTQKLVVTSRVYSKATGAGEKDSMGQDFAGVPASFAIGLHEKTQVVGVHQTLPSADSDFRFNFGFVETTGHTVTVRVRAFDGNGADQGFKDFQVREFSQRQVAFKDNFPTVSTDNARLEVEVTSGSGKVIAYGSGIANGSQDPTTFEMSYKDSLLGINTVQHDATLTGDGTAGAPLGIADGGVTAAKIADGVVSPAKIDATGAAHGQVLKYGSSVAWRDDGLTLPYSATVDAPGRGFDVTNTYTAEPAAAISGTGYFGVEGSSSNWVGVAGVVGGPNPGLRSPSAVAGTTDDWTGVSGRSWNRIGVWGEHLAPTGTNPGVLGETASADSGAVAVYGHATSTDPGGYSTAVRGVSEGTSGSGIGVWGSQNGFGWGVFGVTPDGIGVYGLHSGQTEQTPGVLGVTNSTATGAVGVQGEVAADVAGDGSAGVLGLNRGTGKFGVGVWGQHNGMGWGVFGASDAGHAVHGSTGTGVGVFGAAWSQGGVAGRFEGDVDVTGTLTKGGGAFRIDHPLDPENRYLSHSFVESPDMMNIYNGNIVTDVAGEAVVTLPDYFSALNRDFRYQLTVIGEFAQAIVGREIEGNSFTIRTSKPNLKVSWQVTGIRQDRWAEKHRIAVEQDKPEKERGFYLHPELYDQPKERGVAAALWPDAVGDAKAPAVRPRSAQQAKREKQQ